MEFKGRIYKVLETTSGKSRDGKEWQKQEFIFEFFEHDTDRYSDKVVLSVMNDRIKEYDLHEGDEVMIGFGHSVREYNGRWFNDIRLYKLDKAERMPLFENNPTQPVGETNGTVVGAPNLSLMEEVAEARKKEERDDLPF